MRRYVDETLVPQSPAQLYAALSDIASWPAWDSELERAEISGPAVAGTSFTLRPKGGPNVRLKIVEAEAPHRFVDLAFLPLARMRTVHEFIPAEGGTLVRATIEISGVASWLWDRIVARRQAAGARAQTRCLAEYAAGAA